LRRLLQVPEQLMAMELNCPIPYDTSEVITLAHGGGGRMTQKLIDELYVPLFSDETSSPAAHDGFVSQWGPELLAFTTDSFVVSPRFFPGGDIGKLAVCGTVNDLAMCGALPMQLSLGFILEEGFALSELKRICQSIAATAKSAGVCIVTGDTKVVERGKADGIFINTSGIGKVITHGSPSPKQIETGDSLIVSGDIGRHGMALIAQREGLAFELPIESDCAPLHDAVRSLVEAGIELHCLRDCTRGGLATALIELAESSSLPLVLEESKVPVLEPTHAACELLGFDPLFVANEGCFVAAVAPSAADLAVTTLQAIGFINAACVGKVEKKPAGTGRLVLQNELGISRQLSRLSGEQLPRIC
jgi:hydrogenase expression/formation protein HypE